MSDDWYRNTSWDAEIATAFEAKLKRARRKEQYLRIQACMLTESAPEVALELLERYFEMPADFDRAQAYVDKANALQALARIDEAAEAYRRALEVEAENPSLRTRAGVELPYLIATHPLPRMYREALEVLARSQSDCSFPVDYFQWHSARALILAEVEGRESAREDANRARDASQQEQSKFSYHKALGLVGPEHDATLALLNERIGT